MGPRADREDERVAPDAAQLRVRGAIAAVGGDLAAPIPVFAFRVSESVCKARTLATAQ